MRLKSLRTALLIFVMVLPGSQLWSAAVYSYSSPTFCSGPVGGVTPGYGLTCSDFVSASVTYNSVLPANLSDETSNASSLPDVPVDWLFSDGVEEWTPANSFFDVAQVNTDAEGNIDGWDFTLYIGSFSGDEVNIISSTPSSYGEAGVYLPEDTPGFYTAVVNYGPGVDVDWTLTSSTTPEPASAFLCFVGVIVAGTVGRLRYDQHFAQTTHCTPRTAPLS